MQIKKNKAAIGITAGTLAVALALTGTYAWQSISQSAKNQAVGYANYGGRLHDDFNGTNKDVYVENFTVEDENGAPIFVRVRLDEYMETGMEAGTNATGTTRKATSLVTGATLSNKSSWKTYVPGSTTDPFRDYWELKMGGETVYMPTFDKNQDSLAVDVNGSYEGPDGKVDAPNPDRYLDYVTYTVGQEKTAQAVYDMDHNDTDEGDTAVVGTNITQKQETHTAKMTQKAEIITMEQWKTEKNYALGKYWVYDTDGWAYWGEALQPGDTTGLLLDAVTMKKIPDTHWYYGINVVGQFASVRDWGSATDKDGFYDPTGNSKAPTDDALLLLNLAAGYTKEIRIFVEDNVKEVAAGNTLQLTTDVFLGEREMTNADVVLTLSGNTSASTTLSSTGLLTVGADEADGNILTITATSTAEEPVYPASVAALSDDTGTSDTSSEESVFSDTTTIKIKVKKSFNATLTSLAKNPGTTSTVTFDGYAWYVLAKEGNKALLFSKAAITGLPSYSATTAFNTTANNAETVKWKNSPIRTHLNGTFYNKLTTLKGQIVETDIHTRTTYNSTAAYDTTKDKIFLPSEADLTGRAGSYVATTDERDYTYKNSIIIKSGSSIWSYSRISSSYYADYCWTRTAYNASSVFTYHYNGSSYNNYSPTTYSAVGVRPMMWVSLI